MAKKVFLDELGIKEGRNRSSKFEKKKGTAEKRKSKVETKIDSLIVKIDDAIFNGAEYLEQVKKMDGTDASEIEKAELVIRDAQISLLGLKDQLAVLRNRENVDIVEENIRVEIGKIKKVISETDGRKNAEGEGVDTYLVGDVVGEESEEVFRARIAKKKSAQMKKEKIMENIPDDAKKIAEETPAAVITKNEKIKKTRKFKKIEKVEELSDAYNALIEPLHADVKMSEEEIVEEIKKVRNELATAKRFLGKTDDEKLIGNINRMIKMRSDRLEALRAKIDNPEIINNMMVEELKDRFVEIKKIEDEKIKRQELIKLAHEAFEFGDDDFVNQVEDELGIPKSVRWNKIKSVDEKPKLRWRVPNKNISGPEWKEKMRHIHMIKNQIGKIPENFPDKEKREELIGRLVYLSQRVHKQDNPTERSRAYYILGEKYYEANAPEGGMFVLMDEWHKLLAERNQYEGGKETKEVDNEIEIADQNDVTVDEIEIKQVEQAEDVAVVGEDEIVAITFDDEMETADFFAEMSIVEAVKAKEVIDEVERLPAADKKTLFEGLADVGFKTSEVKNRFVKNFLKKVSGGIENKVIANFFSKYSDIYQKQEDDAKRMQQIVGKSGLSKISGVGRGAGLVFKFGRIGFDVMSRSSANPLRYVTMAGMAVGQGMEAAKEVRFENEETIEKTRVDDADRAADEAWLIYDRVVKESGEGIAKEDLDKIYREQLPTDIKNRLDRMKDSGTSLVQKILNKHVDLHIGIINKKIKKINEDKKLSSGDREQQIEELLLRNADFLHDLDRMVGDAGLIDNIAYYSRLSEKTSKTAANLVMIDSVYRLASAGWNMLHLTEKYHDLFGHVSHSSAETVGGHATDVSVSRSMNESIQQAAAEQFSHSAEISSAQSVGETVGEQNIEIKIGGNVNTFSGAINEAVKNADSAVKDNFIHQVLGDNVKIPEEDRQDLLRKAVAKLSIGEVHNGQAVPDLIHNDNVVVLHHDGSWEVQNGEGNHMHEAGVPAETNHEGVSIKIGGNDSEIASPEDRIAAHEQIENFKRITQALQEFNSHGINNSVMEYIGVDSHDPNLLHDSIAMEKLNFLAKYENDLDGFSRATDSLKAIKGLDIAPIDAFTYYDSIKSFEGDGPRIKAVIDLIRGGNMENSLFNLTGVKVTEENFEIKNGVIKIKDYYKKGFDFVLTNKNGEIKIGVDGPARFNWKARGWWGNLRPDEVLSVQSLKDAKEAVEKMSQDLESREPKN